LVATLAACSHQARLPAPEDTDLQRRKAEFRERFEFGANAMRRPNRRSIQALVAPHRAKLEAMPDVVAFGFGIRTSAAQPKPLLDYAFKVYVRPGTTERRLGVIEALPARIGDYDVVVEELRLRSLWGGCDGADPTLHDALRAGINIGLSATGYAGRGTCGTLGMMVWRFGQSPETADSERYFISAEHVLTETGRVAPPAIVSQPGAAWDKRREIGETDGACGPLCSKFEYEVGVVRIYPQVNVASDYVVRRDPYDPGVPSLPNIELYRACGVAKHIIQGQPQAGGCVYGLYRDLLIWVDIDYESASGSKIRFRMLNQMWIEAEWSGDVIALPGDSGMVWVDTDSTAVAITTGGGLIADEFAYGAQFSSAIASPLFKAFADLQITAIKPLAQVVVTCVVERALQRDDQRVLLRTEVAPALHRSDLEPYYRDFRVGGKHHLELAGQMFSDRRLASLATELANALVDAYHRLAASERLDELAISPHDLQSFREFVHLLSPRLSTIARARLQDLARQVDRIADLTLGELAETQHIGPQRK
jgi:hypothetical protein